MISSTNGVDWVLHPAIVSSHLNTIVFVDGRFVIGGNAGVILCSEDGVGWVQGPVVTGKDFTAIGAGVGTNFPTGLFVAIAATNNPGGFRQSAILLSRDGVSWTNNGYYQFGFQNDLYSSIVAGNNRLVASGPSGPSGPSAILSANGTNWSRAFGLVAGPVAFGNGLFINTPIFQVAANDTLLVSQTSVSGDNWPLRSYGGQASAQAACFGGGKFVVVGDLGMTAVSADGTNWTTRRVETDTQLRAVTFGAGFYCTVGGGGLILTSEDGMVWTQRGKGTRKNLFAVAPLNDGFVAVGSGGTVVSSTNGVIWETHFSPTTNQLAAILQANESCVAAGAYGSIVSGPEPDNLALRVTGTSAALQGIAFGQGTFVVVGDAGTVLTSQNAVDWLPQNSGTTNLLAEVVFGHGQFVAAGHNGIILTSTDGATWLPRSSGTTRRFHDIAFGAGHFVAVASQYFGGTGPFVVTSTDGVNWEGASSMFPANPQSSIGYGNGYFFISIPSNLPALALSTDGRNWKIVIATNLASNWDFAYNNGTFASVGRYGIISQSDPLVRLEVRHDGMTHLTWEGPKNRSYRIEGNDTFPAQDGWQELTTSSAPPYSWSDPQSGTRSNRFYRVVLQP